MGRPRADAAAFLSGMRVLTRHTAVCDCGGSQRADVAEAPACMRPRTFGVHAESCLAQTKRHMLYPDPESLQEAFA